MTFMCVFKFNLKFIKKCDIIHRSIKKGKKVLIQVEANIRGFL